MKKILFSSILLATFANAEWQLGNHIFKKAPLPESSLSVSNGGTIPDSEAIQDGIGLVVFGKSGKSLDFSSISKALLTAKPGETVKEIFSDVDFAETIEEPILVRRDVEQNTTNIESTTFAITNYKFDFATNIDDQDWTSVNALPLPATIFMITNKETGLSELFLPEQVYDMDFYASQGISSEDYVNNLFYETPHILPRENVKNLLPKTTCKANNVTIPAELCAGKLSITLPEGYTFPIKISTFETYFGHIGGYAYVDYADYLSPYDPISSVQVNGRSVMSEYFQYQIESSSAYIEISSEPLQEEQSSSGGSLLI